MSGAPAIEAENVKNILLEVLSSPTPQSSPNDIKAFIANVVQPLLPSQFFDEVTVDSAGNLLARRRGKSGAKPLMLYTYAATYPAEGMQDPYPGKVIDVDGRIYLRGRGAAEQRPGLAAVLAGLRAISANPPDSERGIDFVTCVAGEMGNHLVARALVAEHALEPGAVVICVSSKNEMCLGNLGRLDVHVTIHGKPTHSSDPGLGVNALDGARIFLNRLSELPRDRRDPELGLASIAPILLRTSPMAAHTIPGQADITLDCRTLPGDDAGAIMAAFEECARDLGECTAEVTMGHINIPNKVSPDSELAKLASAALLAAGLEPKVIYKRSALDAGYFSSIEAPSIVLGPGDPVMAHSNDERVLLDDVVAGANVYRTLIEAWCGSR